MRSIRKSILNRLAGANVRHTGKMLAGVVLVTLVLGYLSGSLQMTMKWSDLMPANHPHTKQFNHILDEFSSATNIILVVKGDLERSKEYAEAMIPAIKDLKDPLDNKKYVKRVDYKLEIDFMKKHGLKLIKEPDLKNIKELFLDPNLTPLVRNINNSLEKEYLYRDEPLSTREKEDNAYRFLDGIEFFVNNLQKQVDGVDLTKMEIEKSADMLLFGEEYTVSYDKEALVVTIVPTFSIYDADKCISSIKTIQKIIDDNKVNFPDIDAGLAGMVALTHDEMIAAEHSLGYTTLIALVAIFIILAWVFRMWAAPLLALLSLIIGVTWAMGVTAITVGSLNAMTSMMLIILLGLGIDFSIHLISSFTEYRASGKSIEESLRETFDKTGKGILTGGTTTALAFFTLMISDSRGMKEMGFVTGSGLLLILLATFICLPVFLTIRERRLEKKHLKTGRPKVPVKDISWKGLGSAGAFLGKHYLFTAIVGVIITGALFFSARQVTFDTDYRNMEPEGLLSIELDDYILEKFDLCMDYALMVTTNVEDADIYEKRFKEKPSVAIVDCITRYLPPVAKQRKRLKLINDIRKTIENSSSRGNFENDEFSEFKVEMKRLEMNVMELQDLSYLGGQDKVDVKCSEMIGDPEIEQDDNIIRDLVKSLENTGTKQRLEDFQKIFSPYYRKTTLSMSSLDEIDLKDLPESIQDQYMNKKRTEFLITIFPSDSLMDLDFEDKFAKDLESISDKATGMAIIFEVLMDIIAQDGKKALALTFLVVFLLLIIDFRSIKDAVIAMIPLVAGAIWMVGFMTLTGMQFTLMNVMGLPMILGIGIDDGVHIVHRWRAEGKGSIFKVFASTGKAIFLTSLTTMLAFGSLVFSIYRAYGSLGSAMFVGVGSCFITTIIILSAIIGFVDRKNNDK